MIFFRKLLPTEVALELMKEAGLTVASVIYWGDKNETSDLMSLL